GDVSALRIRVFTLAGMAVQLRRNTQSQLIEATENVLALLRGWHKWGTQNRRVLRNSIVHAKRIFRKFDISCSDGGNDSTLWMEILSDLWGLDGDNVIRNAVRSQ
ncbi:hypothetical protein, partial [Aeromonas rivipollensis]|uniref:hypothetical protein n=1 Tax=Aeromonas rivipollensis TaxID=948519 RepID=UPI003D1C03D8